MPQQAGARARAERLVGCGEPRTEVVVRGRVQRREAVERAHDAREYGERRARGPLGPHPRTMPRRRELLVGEDGLLRAHYNSKFVGFRLRHCSWDVSCTMHPAASHDAQARA